MFFKFVVAHALQSVQLIEKQVLTSTQLSVTEIVSGILTVSHYVSARSGVVSRIEIFGSSTDKLLVVDVARTIIIKTEKRVIKSKFSSPSIAFAF